jgi:hypothetical protein
MGTGEVMTTLTTEQDRRDVFLAMVSASAAHHDNLTAAIDCAIARCVANLLGDIMARAMHLTDRFEVDAVMAWAESLVGDGGINVLTLRLLGHAGEIGEMVLLDKPLPEEYALITAAAPGDGQTDTGEGV